MSENVEDPTLEVARQLSSLRRQLLDLRAHRRRSDELAQLQERLAALQDQLGTLRQGAPAVSPSPAVEVDPEAALAAALRRWQPRPRRRRS